MPRSKLTPMSSTFSERASEVSLGGVNMKVPSEMRCECGFPMKLSLHKKLLYYRCRYRACSTHRSLRKVLKLEPPERGTVDEILDDKNNHAQAEAAEAEATHSEERFWTTRTTMHKLRLLKVRQLIPRKGHSTQAPSYLVSHPTRALVPIFASQPRNCVDDSSRPVDGMMNELMEIRAQGTDSEDAQRQTPEEGMTMDGRHLADLCHTLKEISDIIRDVNQALLIHS